MITQPRLLWVCLLPVYTCQVVCTLALGATNHWLTGKQPGLPANANKCNCLSLQPQCLWAVLHVLPWGNPVMFMLSRHCLWLLYTPSGSPKAEVGQDSACAEKTCVYAKETWSSNNFMLFPQPTHNNCLPTSVSQLSLLSKRFGMAIAIGWLRPLTWPWLSLGSWETASMCLSSNSCPFSIAKRWWIWRPNRGTEGSHLGDSGHGH